MASNEEISNLSPDDRIKALLFQYVKLYERWAEDRQTFNKGMAHQAEMLENFTQKIGQFEKQIGNFEQLEPQVREKLIEAVRRSASVMVDNINDNVGHSVTSAVNETAKDLNHMLKDFYQSLTAYKEEMQNSNLRTILITMGTAIVSSLLIVWLLIPKPIMPLSGDDMNIYLRGLNFGNLWPKLSRRTQIEINESARKNFGVSHPFTDLSVGGNGEGQQSGDNKGG
jgi:hypothetical protein